MTPILRCLSALLLASIASGGETPRSVALFKNGLAVVRHEVMIPASGSLRIEGLPDPVHGTFWIESPGKVDVRSELAEVELPAERGFDPYRDLGGRRVLVHLRDGGGTLAGTVVRTDGEGELRPNESAPRILVVDGPGGRAYLDPANVAFVETSDPPKTIRRRRPSLTLSGEPGSPAIVAYLARGLSWAPAYRVDVGDPETLSIRQQATIRNELLPLDGTEVRLISGFPGVDFDSVTSPLSPGTSWNDFFRQLAGRSDRFAGGRAILAQQAVMSNVAASPGSEPVPATPGESTDLHYESIGERSLAVGEALEVEVAAAKARYERIVDWNVPDTRTADGRTIDPWERERSPEKYDDSPWDAVRFSNPFRFPMTTAPALFVRGGEPAGQQLSTWASPGEATTLRINKALGIRTRSSEWEEAGNREIVKLGSRELRKAILRGELFVENHRDRPAKLVVRRRFSGDLLSADGAPKKRFLEEGIDSVNRRNELTFTLDVGPGQSKTLAYRYSALVPN